MHRVMNGVNHLFLGKVVFGLSDSSCHEFTRSRIIKFSEKVFYLVATGAFFDVAGGFLPWAADASVYCYLPWTPLLGLLVPAVFFEGTMFIIASLSIRAAAILAWTGIVLHGFMRKRLVMPRIFILASIILSLLAVFIFAGKNFLFSWGFYSATLGLVCKSVGFLGEVLKVELVLENRQETMLNSDSDNGLKHENFARTRTQKGF